VNDTKERILDTAERLFAKQGYAATSLRGIIAEAGVNLAAVHYHFHSKEALLEAVILRRSVPANRERLALLDRFEKEGEGNPPSLEKVIEAFVAPTLRMSRDPQSGALAQTLRGGTKDLETISNLPLSVSPASDSENVLERLVAFLSAGFRAPVPTHAIEQAHAAVQER
jgi:AcrR family transcriptional regulator